MALLVDLDGIEEAVSPLVGRLGHDLVEGRAEVTQPMGQDAGEAQENGGVDVPGGKAVDDLTKIDMRPSPGVRAYRDVPGGGDPEVPSPHSWNR